MSDNNIDSSIIQKPVKELFTVNKKVMRCNIESHELQRLKYMCMSRDCSSEQKLGCADCFLEQHLNHERINMEEFVQNLKGSYTGTSDVLGKTNQELKMERFRSDLDQDIESQFSEIQSQILSKFEEFKVDFKSHISKKLVFQNEDVEEYKKQLTDIESLANKNFEELDNSEVQNCINFYYENDQIKKGLEDNNQKIQKIKTNVIKNKTKYFEKLRNIWSDILSEHQEINEESANEETSSIISKKGRKRKGKRVSFAPDVMDSPSKEVYENQKKYQTPRKKIKTIVDQPQQQNLEAKIQSEPLSQEDVIQC